jgi:ABC-type branched-subunit amino acid transport system ATPase component/branched-subunit amino acid ABC-type transport system permease component
MPAIFTQTLLSIPLIGAYAMFALGISVIYRASRVLNLAHGAMAMVPAYVAYSLVQAGVPIGIALFLAVIFGAALGVGVEFVFVRRLRPQGPTAQTVGTVAVTGLLIALVAKMPGWGTTPKIAPGVFPKGIIEIGASGLRIGDIGLFLTGVIVSIGLFTFFKRTEVGLAMRGAAQNRRAAALMGIDPDLAASAAWALGGGLAALAGVMLAAVTTLDPYTLSLQVLPAFVAALIGGLENLRGALWGSVIAGLSFGIVPYFAGTPLIGRLARYNGSPQLALAILTLVVMATRGRRIAGSDATEGGLVTTARPPGARKRRIGPGAIVALIALVVWGYVVPFSVLGDSLLAVELALAAMSIVVLTGFVGQISLAQASFVGISALVTGMVVRGWGIGFPLSLIIAAAVAGGAAILLGVIALRVRGLYLAVATLVFAWMCDQFLFKTPWLGANTGSSTIPPQTLGDPAGWPYFDLTERRTLYFIFVAIIALVVFALANLRDTKTGRAFFAVRGSEMAAASLGIDVVRTKLIAFGLAGVLAGLAGSVLILDQRTVVPDQFLFTVSLQYLAIAVVGGLGSLGGALAAGGLFAGLNELFFRVSALSGWLEVVSASLLAFVLLAYPGGLIAIIEGVGVRYQGLGARIGRRVAGPARTIGGALRAAVAPGSLLRRAAEAVWRVLVGLWRRATKPLERFLPGRRGAGGAPERLQVGTRSEDWLATALAGPAKGNGARAGNAEAPADAERPALRLDGRSVRRVSVDERDQRPAMLEARGVVVKFGGLTAVDGASLVVRQGEVTGLIGPNGAGKTTMFNAILGLNDPAAGSVELFGNEATHLPPHLRAALGVARTFQVIQVFSELTIFDNLLVATHLHNKSGLISNLAAGPGTLIAESDARTRVRQVLRLLELEEIADRGVRGLPFGVLRMVELGRALVTGAPLVMLDEPASGLNNAETDRLMHVIGGIRALGVSVLLIEHDVRMVTSVCDYVYVLDRGKLIAEGPPSAIQREPHVVAAYLGASVEAEPAGVA